VAEILAIDPAHAEALALQQAVRERHREEQIAQWFLIATRRLDARAFSDARDAVQHILQAGDPDERGASLLAEIDRRENEYRELAAQKEKLYSQALGAWQAGNVTSALARMERLIEMNSLSGEPVEARHQELYDQVRAGKEAIDGAWAGCMQALARGDFAAALGICEDQLASFPGNALLQVLRVDVMDARRRHVAAELDELNRRLAGEKDLDRKVDLLQEASNRFPEQTQLRLSLEAACGRRDLISSLASSARRDEEAGDYGEALNKWLLIRNLHSQYPAIEAGIERLKAFSDREARMEERTILSLRIAQQIETGQIEEGVARPGAGPARVSGYSRIRQTGTAGGGPSRPSSPGSDSVGRGPASSATGPAVRGARATAGRASTRSAQSANPGRAGGWNGGVRAREGGNGLARGAHRGH
jgi:hypothetical protein